MRYPVRQPRQSSRQLSGFPTVILGLCALGFCAGASALTLSPAHLAAAERLGCVLADDALGQLDESQFNRRFDAAVRGFDEESVDVIYAKALGYIDGLLFSAPPGADPKQRLKSFSSSSRCRATASLDADSRRVAL
ncbi:MAG: hypothetical protein V2I82_08015 [Halieaceae bacterium]|jgi:hypothetical protein|nr:hypothetical protein [Halieaceae bacterium]